MPNIFLGTLILYALNLVFVRPLAGFFLRRRARLRMAELAGAAPEEVQREVNTMATIAFILADVLVLSIGGSIAGLTGHPFIGITWSAKAWPGMLAFIATSFLFASLVHPV